MSAETPTIAKSDQRRSPQITVDRGGELIFFAPPRCEPGVLEKFVRRARGRTAAARACGDPVAAGFACCPGEWGGSPSR